MALLSPKQKVRLGLFIYTITAALLLTISWQYFAHGNSVFNIGNRWINIAIASVTLVLGLRDVLRVLQRILVLATGNAANFTNKSRTEEETIPEYGYRDKWERENL